MRLRIAPAKTPGNHAWHRPGDEVHVRAGPGKTRLRNVAGGARVALGIGQRGVVEQGLPKLLPQWTAPSHPAVEPARAAVLKPLRWLYPWELRSKEMAAKERRERRERKEGNTFEASVSVGASGKLPQNKSGGARLCEPQQRDNADRVRNERQRFGLRTFLRVIDPRSGANFQMHHCQRCSVEGCASTCSTGC